MLPRPRRGRTNVRTPNRPLRRLASPISQTSLAANDPDFESIRNRDLADRWAHISLSRISVSEQPNSWAIDLVYVYWPLLKMVLPQNDAVHRFAAV
jgi:hypothetical protein